ncbi:RNA polymerase sigma factor [Mucilaginibacter calamicampi]|uniref:RNA polymerase sigma factor n=1 Tax=Mucilaginibacter calamicampi TaxID=1302352 RepID=A0ABW2Z1Z0_9SPHI
MNFLKSHNNYSRSADEVLLLKYRETGDLEVLAALYEKYMHLVYGLCIKYLKDKDSSKDAVMQIFEELIIKSARHEVSNFKSWLHVLTRNFCLSQMRSVKNKQKESLDAVDNMSDGVQHDQGWDDEMWKLDQCKQKLSQEQRTSIELFFIADKCYKEIADSTGYDVKEVKSYIQNGKRNLKICMEKSRGKK